MTIFSTSKQPMTSIVNDTTTASSCTVNRPDIIDSKLATVLPSSCSITTSSTTIDECRKTHEFSTVRLLFAHIGAALTLFLATTDATIVSTSLPTISSELNASQNHYTWVGIAYMLTQTAFQPLYGRISELVGRKNVLYVSMAIFAIGSLLCGAAQNINWLIAARALAGVGGGGIVSAVWVLTAEIVPIEQRAKWSQALSITWSCSAVAGPLIGGIFSGQSSLSTSWRWGFYINLPICLVAFLVLVLSLRGMKPTPPTGTSWRDLARKFDFIGLVLFMTGTSCLVVGFSFANEVGWKAVSTLLLILIGFAVLLCGGVYEKYTTRECLFPPTIFSGFTTVIILVITFLHQITFTSGTFYLALFYQAANGSTPLEAGLKLLPYSLGSSLASIPAAWFIGYWQKRTNDTSGQKLIILSGLLISTIGFGVMNLLNEDAYIYAQVIYPLIAGIGLGMLFHAPYQVFSRSLKAQELALGTSAFFLVRFTGATIGLSLAGMIFSTRAIPRLPTEFLPRGSVSSVEYSSIRTLQPLELRMKVLQIVSSSIQTIWTVWTPCLGLAFLLAFTIRTVSLYEDTDGSKEVVTQPATEKDESEKIQAQV